MLKKLRTKVPDAVQILGAVSLVTGLFLTFGAAIGLLATGALSITAGVLLERNGGW